MENNKEKEIKKLWNLFNKGNFSEILKKEREIFKKFKNEPKFLKLFGLVYDQYALSIQVNFKRKKYQEKAKSYFNMLFKEKPYLFEALKGLGLVELHQGNLNKALYFYKKALSLNPKEYSIYIDIGNVYQALKKYKTALKWYKKALIKKELKPFVFTNLALLYLKQGKILLAKKYARLVILNTNKKNNMLGLKQKMKEVLKIYI